MGKKNKIVAIIIMLVWMILIACSLVSGLDQRAEQAADTAQALATQADLGAGLASTLQAGLTAAANSQLMKTAQSLAGTAAESGLAQTAQALATEVGPALAQTAIAAATEQIPGLVETARAYITEQGPGAVETAQALATRLTGGGGDAPEDIPVVSGPIENFYATDNLVMYQTELPLDEVEVFYQNSMPTNGWIYDPNGSITTQYTAILQYTQAGRAATVTLNTNPGGQGTIVLITISIP